MKYLLLAIGVGGLIIYGLGCAHVEHTAAHVTEAHVADCTCCYCIPCRR